jgi:hypothetical protein
MDSTYEEMIYWWIISSMIDLIRRYGYNQVITDLMDFDSALFKQEN